MKWVSIIMLLLAVLQLPVASHDIQDRLEPKSEQWNISFSNSVRPPLDLLNGDPTGSSR
jgi:hypothetical protein